MSDAIDPAAVLQAAENFQDPESGRSVVKMDQVRDISIENNELSVTLALTTYAAPLWNETRDEFQTLLTSAFPRKSFDWRQMQPP